MTISEAFVDFIEAEGFGTFGTDIFIGAVPQDAPDTAMWVLSAGGAPVARNETNEMRKRYVLSLYYRSNDAEEVYQTLQDIEEVLNSDACTQLGPYDTLEIEATLFPSDQDLDIEDRTVGLMEVSITIYA